MRQPRNPVSILVLSLNSANCISRLDARCKGRRYPAVMKFAIDNQLCDWQISNGDCGGLDLQLEREEVWPRQDAQGRLRT
ncbi:hypothetical protein D3C85_1258190 [compost metagenome]